MDGLTVSDACTACGACLLTCPEHALRPVREGGAVTLAVVADACTGCGDCVEVCPVDAIDLVGPVDVTDADLLEVPA